MNINFISNKLTVVIVDVVVDNEATTLSNAEATISSILCKNECC